MGLRICQLCNVDYTLHHFILPLVDGMQDAGWRVDSVCSDGPFVARLRERGYRVVTVPISRGFNPVAHLKTVILLVRLFRREQYDAVHVHTPVAALLGRIAARMARVPLVIYTAHGFFFHDEMPRLTRRAFIAAERFGGYWTDLLFAQSAEDGRAAVDEHIMAADRVSVIGNGVDPRRFDPQSVGTQRPLRAALGIPEHAFLTGMICRQVREKGIAEFLDAAIRIAEMHPHAWFVLIGERLPSDHAGSVAAEVQRAKAIVGPRLILTGPREDIPELLAAMDLFCLPSWREGMPRTIIEAMMMARPVVATDIRGAREEVIPEQTGLLVPTRCADTLTRAISRCIASPDWAKHLGIRGRERAIALYDERNAIARQIQTIARHASTHGLLTREPVAGVSDIPLF